MDLLTRLDAIRNLWRALINTLRDLHNNRQFKWRTEGTDDDPQNKSACLKTPYSVGICPLWHQPTSQQANSKSSDLILVMQR